MPKPSKIIGLDVGSYAVKLVHLQKETRGYSVSAAAMTEIGAATGNQDVDFESSVVAAIDRCVALANAKPQLAVCSVSGPEVAVRNFQFPHLPGNELESAVMLEASQVCPFNVEQNGVVDYQVDKSSDAHASGILVAATRDTIHQRIHLLEQSNVIAGMLDVDGLALLNCFMECEAENPPAVAVLLNIGHTYTNLAVLDQEQSPLIRDIQSGGKTIIAHMAQQTGQNPQNIQETLFCGYGETPLGIDMETALVAACENLIREVRQTMEYCSIQQGAGTIETVYVTGGFAQAQGLTGVLQEQLGTEVTLWNPFIKIPCTAGTECRELLQKSGPMLAVAAGLAMRTI